MKPNPSEKENEFTHIRVRKETLEEFRKRKVHPSQPDWEMFDILVSQLGQNIKEDVEDENP